MKVVQTNNAPQAIGPYSQGIIVNNMFYSSGQIPLTASGELVAGDVTVQTEQVFQNLQAVLEEAGVAKLPKDVSVEIEVIALVK